MSSIRQNAAAGPRPDYRNLGIAARALVAVNLLALVAALAGAPDFGQAVDAFVYAAALVEPPLIATLALLYAVAPRLRRLSVAVDWAVVVIAACLSTAATHALLGDLAGVDAVRAIALAAVAALTVTAYLHLHARAYSPALAEARLQALQARIRPHFMFNSLNAVLSLIRVDPRRAERALEDLADLFRALMSDGRQLVRLDEELSLVERYAGIEQLRLGDRLRIAWELDAAPVDALLPPLLLQPLLENAVHHGVEPGTGTGEVLVRVERRGERVLLRVENPYHGVDAETRGNHMALDNIRERLMLFFDAEARLESRIEGGRYRVEIEIPYRV